MSFFSENRRATKRWASLLFRVSVPPCQPVKLVEEGSAAAGAKR